MAGTSQTSEFAPGDAQPVRLFDGAWVEIRPLEPADRAGLAAAVARLSPRTLYLRFASPKPRMTAADLAWLAELEHHAREALVAIDPLSGRGIAVARYVELPGQPEVVDVAVTVDDAWQGRGLGSVLVTRLIERARAEGHTVLQATVLAENQPSLRLLRRQGFALSGRDGAMLELRRPLSRPRERACESRARRGSLRRDR